MAYDSVLISTISGEKWDLPVDRYKTEHTKHFGIDVVMITEFAVRHYGDKKPQRLAEEKRNHTYIPIININSISYRNYL